MKIELFYLLNSRDNSVNNTGRATIITNLQTLPCFTVPFLTVDAIGFQFLNTISIRSSKTSYPVPLTHKHLKVIHKFT